MIFRQTCFVAMLYLLQACNGGLEHGLLSSGPTCLDLANCNTAQSVGTLLNWKNPWTHSTGSNGEVLPLISSSSGDEETNCFNNADNNCKQIDDQDFRSLIGETPVFMHALQLQLHRGYSFVGEGSSNNQKDRYVFSGAYVKTAKLVFHESTGKMALEDARRHDYYDQSPGADPLAAPCDLSTSDTAVGFDPSDGIDRVVSGLSVIEIADYNLTDNNEFNFIRGSLSGGRVWSSSIKGLSYFTSFPKFLFEFLFDPNSFNPDSPDPVSTFFGRNPKLLEGVEDVFNYQYSHAFALEDVDGNLIPDWKERVITGICLDGVRDYWQATGVKDDNDDDVYEWTQQPLFMKMKVNAYEAEMLSAADIPQN